MNLFDAPQLHNYVSLFKVHTQQIERLTVSAAPVTARFLEGMAGRMLDTGVSMAVLNTGLSPVIQKQSTDAGLQPGFDPMRLALAPLEGFVGGAVLHGAAAGIRPAVLDSRRGP